MVGFYASQHVDVVLLRCGCGVAKVSCDIAGMDVVLGMCGCGVAANVVLLMCGCGCCQSLYNNIMFV